MSFHTEMNDPTILMDKSLLDYPTLDENYIYIEREQLYTSHNVNVLKVVSSLNLIEI